MAAELDAGLRDVGERLAGLSVLGDPVRRALYLHVVGRPEAVGRDEAAEAVGIQRSLAAFHLDKLVDAGLLEVSYRRLTGRSGPGAGRPAKLYRRSSREHAVSLPPREYQLAAELLAQAVEEAEGPVRTKVVEVARRFGRRLGEEIGSRLGRRRSRERQLEALAETLSQSGYQPCREGSDLLLRNCPFHALAERHRWVVCEMNLALIEGVVEGSGATGLRPRLEPRPGYCCVAVGPSSTPGPRSQLRWRRDEGQPRLPGR